jgi:uncharacterized membrane-anchored protein
MNFSNALDIVIAIALLVWVVYRQTTWQLVDRSRLWRMPGIMAIVGVFMLIQSKSLTNVRPVDVLILVAELLITMALGAAMGSLARFRSRPQKESDVRNRSGRPTVFDPSVTVVESRTGALGAVLWIAVIAIRIGIELGVEHFFPSALLASTGTILLALAANRAARAFVVINRMERKSLIAA